MTDSGPVPDDQRLSAIEAVALVITLVVGIGVFKTPAVVASLVGSEASLFGFWLVGGLLTLMGALCYAELASCYPHTSGELYYLERAYGPAIANLFGWSRLAVIQTGAIALIAYIFGDYARRIDPSLSSSTYALLAVLCLTGLNAAHFGAGRWTMNILALIKGCGILLLLLIGLTAGHVQQPAAQEGMQLMPQQSGLAMVYVLLAYGGWNEAAYLTADLRRRQQITVVLLASVVIITTIYLLVNLAYLNVLGWETFVTAPSPAWNVVQSVLGAEWANFFGIFVALCALGAMNATMLTGARSTRAFLSHLPFADGPCDDGDHRSLRRPLLMQSAVALLLVGFGAFQRDGFEAMVAFTAPVFWIFMALIVFGLVRLRRQYPHASQVYRVPFYPLTPLVFGVACLFMIWESLLYAGTGALLGVLVLLLGLPIVRRM